MNSSSFANSNIWSPRPSCENIILMPCQAIRIVANDDKQPVAEPDEHRLVGRQQRGDRLLNRRDQVQRGLRRHGLSSGRTTVAARCGGRHLRPPRTPRSPPPRSRQVTSCMFIVAASVSRARLESTSSCSTTPLSNCVRAWRCRAADQRGAADLVEHRRRALLERPVGHVLRRAPSIAGSSLRPL